MLDECTGDRTIQWRTGSLWIVASQGLCHEPLTCANVANPESMGQEYLKINTNTHMHILVTHSSVARCSIVQSLRPSPPQLHRQSCQWGSSYPRRGVKRLERSKSFWPVGTDLITVATWAFELEMHLRIKAEELPGGTALQQRTVQIREEVRKCTFLERIKEMFYFEIENLRIRILKGASALYCI